MKSKLHKLFNDPKFGRDAQDIEPGIMIYQNKKTLNYLILTYEDHYKVYLSLFDEKRDYLVSSKSSDLNKAKQLATKAIEKKINKPIH